MSSGLLLVTPAHNEAAEVEGLVDSVRRSSLPPERWIVVDDASSDGTGDELREAGSDLDFLTVHRIEPAGREAGQAEAAAEYMGFRYSEVVRAGFAQIDPLLPDARYVGILDADIRVEPDYFEQLIARLEQEPRLGIVSGALVSREADGRRRLEAGQRLDIPRGGLRVMKRACFEEVGRFARCRAPDSVMNVRAWAAGWRTELLPDVIAETTRPTGSRTGSSSGRRPETVSLGQRAWNLGRPFWQVCLFAGAKVARGELADGLGWLQGYVDEAVRGGERLEDPVVRRYYRRERPKEWLAIAASRLRGESNERAYVEPLVVREDVPRREPTARPERRP